jgi:hypothetical protein
MPAPARSSIFETKRIVEKLPRHQRDYFDRGFWQGNVKFATRAVEAVYNLDGSRKAKEGVFRGLIWLLTESDGKYSTRYRSMAALNAHEKDIRHDHVFPIKDILFLSSHGTSPGRLISLCCACLVTRREHAILHALDRGNEKILGWDRYYHAGIEVKDMLKRKTLDISDVKAEMDKFGKAWRRSRFCGDASDFET